MNASWPQVPLGELLSERKIRVGVFDADGLPLLGVSNTLGLHRTEKPRIADMSRYLRVNHDWFAYNPMRINVGSIGWAERHEQTGIISPDYVVFSCTDRIQPKLLYLFLRSAIGLKAINLETAGSVRERLYFDSLARIRFSLPPLPEQRRIVAQIEELAGRINEALGLRQTAAQAAKSLWESGANNVLNAVSERHPKKRLADLVTIKGGGTPSKANPFYWTGQIPWITPKDMKVRAISGSIDHISEHAIQQTVAKLIEPEAVLVVVRGMILAHTFPSAVLVVSAAINQDMKALIPNNKILPQFLSAFFWGTNAAILDLVEKSTHDTRKLETGKLLAIDVPVPPLSEQHRILAELDKLQSQVDALSKIQAQTATELDALLPSVLDKAFRGELI
jgi:type I restriction enzyme, S subunit